MSGQLLEEIYQQYKAMIYNYLYRSTLNHHKAEELTQDTFLKAFNTIHQFRHDSSLKTWLFTIARNTYLDDIKKKQHQECTTDLTEVQVPDHTDDFHAINAKLIIRKVLLKLSEKDRTLIMLRDYYGFKYSEIAVIICNTEGQVKVNLHRARKKFKELYSRESEVR